MDMAISAVSLGMIGGHKNGVQWQFFTDIRIAVLSDQPWMIAIDVGAWIELKVDYIDAIRYFVTPIFIRFPSDDIAKGAS